MMTEDGFKTLFEDPRFRELKNKHGNACVILLIEYILNCIKSILPNITRLILKSGNVILHQNITVSFFIHIIRISTRLFVYHYINTDTGYGNANTSVFL